MCTSSSAHHSSPPPSVYFVHMGTVAVSNPAGEAEDFHISVPEFIDRANTSDQVPFKRMSLLKSRSGLQPLCNYMYYLFGLMSHSAQPVCFSLFCTLLPSPTVDISMPSCYYCKIHSVETKYDVKVKGQFQKTLLSVFVEKQRVSKKNLYSRIKIPKS